MGDKAGGPAEVSWLVILRRHEQLKMLNLHGLYLQMHEVALLFLASEVALFVDCLISI